MMVVKFQQIKLKDFYVSNLKIIIFQYATKEQKK